MADCHIGGWREDKLNELTIQVFRDAIDICIKEHVAFILIAGDLFDTALPNIDLIKEVASILEKVKRRDIEVYIIPGSHDFSPSGKTFLDVLENSGLVINVNKYDGDNKLLFFEDKTGVKITGLLGKRSGLEREDYKNLEKEHLENEKGFKIFMFHTTLEEFKPKYLENVKGQNYADLPKNFNYYAGGHPHFVYCKSHNDYGKIAYPGPIFPNNFKELEMLNCGGFFIVDINDNKINERYIKLPIKEVLSLTINADNKTFNEVELEIISKLRNNCSDKIVTLRIEGCLKSGNSSDINFKNINEIFSDAYCILRNTNKLLSNDFEEIIIDTGNVSDIEHRIITEHISQSRFSEEIINNAVHTFDKEKGDGEKNDDFEKRIIEDISKVLRL